MENSSNEQIDEFIKRNSPRFKKWKQHLDDFDWSKDVHLLFIEEKDIVMFGKTANYEHEFYQKDNEFRVQVGLVKKILDRLKFFIDKSKGDYKNPKFKAFFKLATNIISIHLKRCDKYSLEIDETDIKIHDLRSKEAKFNSEVFAEYSKVDSTLSSYGFVEEEDKGSDYIEFFDNKKASLAVYKEVVRDFPAVKEKMKTMKIDFDSLAPQNLHILNENPPIWNPEKHFWEQEKETVQYYVDELKKIEDGVEIDGVYFDGWIYYHINHFRVKYPTTVMVNGHPKSKDVTGRPPLRDNEWIMSEYFIKASREQGYALIAATRRAAKTTLNASRVERAKVLGRMGILLAGGSSSDLGQIIDNCKVNMDNCEPAFALDSLGETKEGKGEEFGIRTKDNKRKRHAALYVKNLDGGTNKKKGESLAGFTIDEFILDEAFKFPFMNQLQGLEPALFGEGVMRATPLLTACVCAGTKVWNNEGNLVNIEDLKQDDGIVGFDIIEEKISKENITYWQKPIEKECYRLTTNKGRILECSHDHPILTRTRDAWDFRKGRDKPFRKMFFDKTENLKVGQNIGTVENIPIEGNNRMWNPRLVGLLIGDGSYGKDKTPILSNCDEEVNSYISNNFDCIVERERLTLDGKHYKETRIKGITKELRNLGIYGQTKNNKRLPLNVHSYRNEDIYELVAGLIDSDGHVSISKNNATIGVTFSGIELTRELQLLLQKIGIHSNIQKKMPSKSSYGTNPYYTLQILDRDSILVFCEKIKLLIKYKQINLERLIDIYKHRKSGAKQKNLKNIRFENIVSIENIGLKPVYNLTAENTNTYIANGIITHNTGGDDELAADGIKMLSNPEANKVILMNWDDLNRGVPSEHKTWTERPFGLFLPGQMSIRFGQKNAMTMSDYLGLKAENCPSLSKLIIGVTDWKKTLDNINIERDNKVSDKKAYVKLLAYHPIDPSEIFLSGKVNPFPVAEAKAHRKYLWESGLWDRRRELYKDSNGKIQVELSQRPLIEYPYKGVMDAPFMIFENPPENKVPIGTYTAGFDDYKQEDSDTDSVATFYVWKNEILGDPFSKKIVASLSIRPLKHKTVWEKWLLLMEAYQLETTCFGENEDFKIKDFLDNRQLTEKYLANSLDFTSSFNRPNNEKRKFGWTPRAVKRFIFDFFVEYCNETFDIEVEDKQTGEIKIVELKGVQRIDDIYLLDEIISYQENANVDRIIGAMGGYAYLEYLIKALHWVPSKSFDRFKGRKEEARKEIQRTKSFYQKNLKPTYRSRR